MQVREIMSFIWNFQINSEDYNHYIGNTFSSKNVPLDVKNLNKAIIKTNKQKNYLAKKSCKGKTKLSFIYLIWKQHLIRSSSFWMFFLNVISSILKGSSWFNKQIFSSEVTAAIVSVFTSVPSLSPEHTYELWGLVPESHLSCHAEVCTAPQRSRPHWALGEHFRQEGVGWGVLILRGSECSDKEESNVLPASEGSFLFVSEWETSLKPYSISWRDLLMVTTGFSNLLH